MANFNFVCIYVCVTLTSNMIMKRYPVAELLFKISRLRISVLNSIINFLMVNAVVLGFA